MVQTNIYRVFTFLFHFLFLLIPPLLLPPSVTPLSAPPYSSLSHSTPFSPSTSLSPLSPFCPPFPSLSPYPSNLIPVEEFPSFCGLKYLYLSVLNSPGRKYHTNNPHNSENSGVKIGGVQGIQWRIKIDWRS